MRSVLLALGVLTTMAATAPALAGNAYPHTERQRFMNICAAETPVPICSCALLQFEARMAWPDYQRLDKAYLEGRNPDRGLSRIADQVYDYCITHTNY